MKSKILAEASPSIPLAELQMKCSKTNGSLQTVRTCVAETLVPDTVKDMVESEECPTSSVSVIPETIGDDQTKNDRYSSNSQSEYVFDIDEFLWGN